MTKRILVTGVNGFVGKHLVRELSRAGCKVSGASLGTFIAPEIKSYLDQYIACDLSRPDEVNKLDFKRFDTIISLAGLTNVRKSFDQRDNYIKINVAVLVNMCNRIVAQGISPRVIAISTGTAYETNQPMPLTEKSKLITSNGSPYALSKIKMENAAFTFNKRNQLECIVVRPFNHIGPGQEAGFLVPDLYQKIMRALKKGGAITTGNLSTRRDYTDVRDVVRAYVDLALASQGTLKSPVYNICSGVSHSGEEILAYIKKYIPGAKTIRTVVDPGLVRVNDPDVLVGSNKLINQAVGWQPTIPLGQTIKDFVTSQAPIL